MVELTNTSITSKEAFRLINAELSWIELLPCLDTGHYYLKEDYVSESPFFVLFAVMKEILEKKENISKIILPFQKYFHSCNKNL